MVRGEAFTHDQLERLERARDAAEVRAGVRFVVRVGAVDGDVTLFAERVLANLVDRSSDPAVVILVSPGQRLVRITMTQSARRRISDQAAGLAVVAMTSSFAVGDLVGGILDGLRQLADAAGAPSSRERLSGGSPE